MSREFIIKVIAFLFLCSITSVVRSQSVQYTYDAAGNRIAKTIIVFGSRAYERGNDYIHSSEEIEKNIHISNGLLEFQIIDFDPKFHYVVSIHDTGGRCFQKLVPILQNTIIDIREYPSGIYILSIRERKNIRTYRILKK